MPCARAVNAASLLKLFESARKAGQRLVLVALAQDGFPLKMPAFFGFRGMTFTPGSIGSARRKCPRLALPTPAGRHILKHGVDAEPAWLTSVENGRDDVGREAGEV